MHAHKTSVRGYGRALWLMQGFYKANGACGLHEETIFLDANGTRSFFIQRNLNVLQVFHTGWNCRCSRGFLDEQDQGDRGQPSPGEEFSFDLMVLELAILRVKVHEYDIIGEERLCRANRVAAVGAAAQDPRGGALQSQGEQVPPRQSPNALQVCLI